MALRFNENIAYTGLQQNFERDSFATIENMRKYSENYLPNIFIATCEEDGNVYVFNKSNTLDPVTGKWRMLGSALQKDLTASFTVGGVKEGKTLSAGKPIEDIVREMLTGEETVTLPAYYGTASEKISDLTQLTKVEPVSSFTITVNANNEYIVIACPNEEENVSIFSNGFDYTNSFVKEVTSTYTFYYSETKVTCSNFNYTITYN